MIGGGQGAFIGAVHRMAAALDGRWNFCAGALSSTPERSLASARELGLAADRSYATWRDMLKAESARDPRDRVDAVAIVTPNATHFEIASAFLEAGFNIICDKPLVTSTADADKLVAMVNRSGAVFVVMYNYTGYPMVKQAAAMVRAGEIGDIRKVFVEYHQGWLATPLADSGQKQAAWRGDPAAAGAGAIGDIGTHAENLLTTITGLEIESLCADLASIVPGRRVDDDAAVLLRFKGGARGVLTASQVCIGDQNGLTIRVHGATGSLRWAQEEPNTVIIDHLDGTRRVLTRGVNMTGSAAAAVRIPPGHPEGFIEAFGNIYRAAADAIDSRRRGERPSGIAAEAPTVEDGARGVRFVERVLASRGAWVRF